MSRTGLLQSVERAMRIMDHVAAAPGPLPAKQIAAALGLALPTTYHLLSTLVTGGYLVHLSEEKAYGLGHRVDDLARGLRRQIAVPAEVERVARVLHEQASAAAYYAALRDNDMIVAHISDCAEHPRIQVLDVGFHQAPHATAFGKLMLAKLGPGAAQDVLDGTGTPSITPHTVTDRQLLRRQFEQVRTTGLAVEVDEFQADLSCMAAPVTDGAGRFIGAVAISMPTAQLRERRWAVERAVRIGAVRATRAVSLNAAARLGRITS